MTETRDSHFGRADELDLRQHNHSKHSNDSNQSDQSNQSNHSNHSNHSNDFMDESLMDPKIKSVHVPVSVSE